LHSARTGTVKRDLVFQKRKAFNSQVAIIPSAAGENKTAWRVQASSAVLGYDAGIDRLCSPMPCLSSHFTIATVIRVLEQQLHASKLTDRLPIWTVLPNTDVGLYFCERGQCPCHHGSKFNRVQQPSSKSRVCHPSGPYNSLTLGYFFPSQPDIELDSRLLARVTQHLHHACHLYPSRTVLP
jgi:hypothetical protein